MENVIQLLRGSRLPYDLISVLVMFKLLLEILQKHARYSAGCNNLPVIIDTDRRLILGHTLMRNCFFQKRSEIYGIA